MYVNSRFFEYFSQKNVNRKIRIRVIIISISNIDFAFFGFAVANTLGIKNGGFHIVKSYLFKNFFHYILAFYICFF